MNDRKQKVKELMESFQTLRRSMAFQTKATAHMPRITPSQWGVLMMIQGRPGSTVKDVAQALGITSSAATQLIDGLAASGYVVREERPEDRRSVTLALSQKTKKRVEKMKRNGIRHFMQLFAVLSDREFDQFILLNKKIVERSLKK